MSEGRVLYADADDLQVLRYVGTVRLPLAPAVNTFLAKWGRELAKRRVVVDLSQTEAIDSTNLGEIARIADLLSKWGAKRATIVSTRQEISDVLHSMAFHEFFDICGENVSAQDGEPIEQECTENQPSAQLVVSAHRKLMEMSQSNRAQFADVVAMMESEIMNQSGDGRTSRVSPRLDHS